MRFGFLKRYLMKTKPFQGGVFVRLFCSIFFFGNRPLEASVNFTNGERWGLGAHPLLLSAECESRKFSYWSSC